MRKTALAIATATAVLLAPLGGLAQGPRGQRGAVGGWGRCAGPEELGLSGDQKKRVEKAEEAYGGSIRTLRNQWTSKRLEFQELLANPKAGEDGIRAKAKELTAAQAELQKAVLEFRLRVRAVLTPDQLDRWCAGRRRCGEWGSCFEP